MSTKPVVGLPGQKYGLQVRIGGGAGGGGGSAMGGSGTQIKRKSVFGGDDDDDDDGKGGAGGRSSDEDGGNSKKECKGNNSSFMNRQSMNNSVNRMGEAKRRKLEEQLASQDAAIFGYDEVYNTLEADKKRKEVALEARKQDRTPKYISDLLKKAEFRKKEHELIFERNQLKEREKEDHMFEGKEKFVTSAYKQKLKEDQRFKEELDAEDKKNTENAAAKKGNMNSFYSSYLDQKTGVAAPKADGQNDNGKGKDNAQESRKVLESQNGERREQQEGRSSSHAESSRSRSPTLRPPSDRTETVSASSPCAAPATAAAATSAVVVAQREESELQRKEKVEAARQRYLARRADKALLNADGNGSS